MKKWFKGLGVGDKIMVVGLLLLFLTSGSLLIYGVLHHHEQGLLTACDSPGGSLDYNGECFEVRWNQSQFPLRTYLSSTNPSPPLSPDSELSSLISYVNRSLGFRALTPTSDSSSADIVIDFAGALDVGSLRMKNAYGGALHHRRADGSLWCEVHTWNTGTAELADKALTHELGHCLGLAHDDFQASAMYPSIVQDGNRPTRLRFTDSDVQLLRTLYH